MGPYIVRDRQGYRVFGVNVDTGQSSLVDTYPTRARAERKLAEIDRWIQADAFAADAINDAIARVQRKAHVPRQVAIESVAEAASNALADAPKRAGGLKSRNGVTRCWA